VRRKAPPGERGAAKANGRIKAAMPDEGEGAPDNGRSPRIPRIVRVRSSSSKPMREDEAAAELVESGRGFLVFEDAKSGKNHVLFKRDDGTLGLIEA